MENKKDELTNNEPCNFMHDVQTRGEKGTHRTKGNQEWKDGDGRVHAEKSCTKSDRCTICNAIIMITTE